MLWEEEIKKPKEEKYLKVHLEKAGLRNREKIKKQKLKNQNNVVPVLRRKSINLPTPVMGFGILYAIVQTVTTALPKLY